MAKALRRYNFQAPKTKTRWRTRTVQASRRGLSRAAQVAREEKHTIAAVGAAAVCGLAESRNVALPHIEALGTAGTYGVVAYVAGRYMKSKTLSHVATGLLSVAAYKLTADSEPAGPEGHFAEGEYESVEGALDDQYAAAVQQANAEAEAQDVEEMEPEPE